MKFKLIITTLLLSLFLVGSAFAVPYSVKFDADGATGTKGFAATEIWGFDTEGIGKNTVGGVTTTTYIVQDLGANGILSNGDTFTETFTTRVLNGTLADGNPSGAPYWSLNKDLKIDISLGGYISGYSNGGGLDTTRTGYLNILNDSYFTNMTSGAATMYLDNNNDNIFNAGDTKAAAFSFANAAPSFLDANVWPGSTGSALYSVAFKLDAINQDDIFWTDGSFPIPIADLIAAGFIFTYNDGSAHAVGLEGGPTSPNNTILLGFDDNGIDVKFDAASAVPEPASMLLVGIGLLGLAGVSRRKCRN